MLVAVPVVIYGIASSPIDALPETNYMIEGRSILYLGLLYWLKGPIPHGYDVMLTPTALAGWAGLLVTMINLLPFGQLDGGHVAYAMWGRRQDRISRYVIRLLPALALLVCLAYGLPTYLEGARGDRLVYDASAGLQWLVWAFVLWILTRATGPDHPPTEDSVLSPRRRIVGWFTLSLFALLFMPTSLHLVKVWANDPDLAHGFLIVPIALWLVWEKRAPLRQMWPRPVVLPLLLMLPVGFLWLLAVLVYVLVVQQFAFVGLLILALWSVLGTPRWTWAR